METMRPGKGVEDNEDDDDEEFAPKKDGCSSQEEFTGKGDRKSGNQKANLSRSKHSVTEQRRRSKINDRFQILRDLLPQSDQKRDKASFLLEVIEYVRFLQEKVNKYEASYQGWNQEPTKLMPWRNTHGPGHTMMDHSRIIKDPGSGFMLTSKFNDNNIAVTPSTLANAQNSIESDPSMSVAYKSMDPQHDLANKAVSMPISLQPNVFTASGRSEVLAQPLHGSVSDGDNMSSQHQAKLYESYPCTMECQTNDALNEREEMAVEGGTISITSTYSQGLLNNLTHALQSSGVDLSQACISVQIDLGKRAIDKFTSTTSNVKEHGDPSASNRVLGNSLVTSSSEDSEQAEKRLKTGGT
ncbi:hypothetical protein Scep_021958 [Stephania cephalantha]|uniref:BHLH domain-containing protein n=2 Tax=Stephania TaxID=147243 RepID=A0AAP0FFF9_9MAGN